MPANRSAIEVHQVTKAYRRGPEIVHALTRVSFSLRAGEVTALMGRSGSGKTTLLNIIAGWEHTDSGEVVFHGSEPDAADVAWSRLAMIPQRLGLLEDLTIQENVELPLLLTKSGRSEVDKKVSGIMAALNLAHLASRLPRETSLGEQQRTSVARALVVLPDVVLADEPTGNQDASRHVAVFEELRAAADRGAACLVAIHNPSALPFCHRVLRLEDGALVADESVDDDLAWRRDPEVAT